MRSWKEIYHEEYERLWNQREAGEIYSRYTDDDLGEMAFARLREHYAKLADERRKEEKENK